MKKLRTIDLIKVDEYSITSKYLQIANSVSDINDEPINEGEAYINVMEDNLITLIEKILSLNLKVGEQVGIISYNEIPLKKIILNGITTISTGFQLMGKIAAELILSNSKEQIEVPFKLTLRASL